MRKRAGGLRWWRPWPRGRAGGDEGRRDGEVDLVGQVGGEELGVDGGAAFNHELPDTALPEIVHRRPEVE